MEKLILVDPNVDLSKTFSEAFAPYPEVEVVNGYFQELESFDCMVSAADSFGLMDGGVDLAIIKFFGYQLEKQVQARIIKEYWGEQPVGTSMIVETRDEKHPFIAHTPTMRVPLRVTRTDNVYNAMFAMLRAVAEHNERSDRKIKTVACPGLGTATGHVSPAEATRQMLLAYQNFKNPPERINWYYARRRQEGVIFGGDVFA